MRSSVVLVVACVLSSLTYADATLESSRRSTITLVDHGYEGLLVAVGESVPEADRAVMLSRIEVGKLSCRVAY